MSPRKAKPGSGRLGPKDHGQLREWLAEAGYRIGVVNSGHYRVTTPEGAYVMTLPWSPSDHRTLKNCVAQARSITGLRLRK